MAGPWDDYQDDSAPADNAGPSALASEPGPWEDYKPWEDYGGSSAQPNNGTDQSNGPRNAGPAPEGAIASGVREFAHSFIPGIAGAAAAPLGAAAGSVVPVAGSLAGGAAAFIGASLATEYAQEKALKAASTIPGLQWLDDDTQRAANREANPNASFAGGLAGGLATMSPVSTAETVAKNVGQRLAGGAAMAGFEAGGEALQGEDFDPAHIAIAFAGGAIAPGVNKLGERVQAPAEKYLAGRPGRTPNPAAAQAHADVLDNSVETAVGDSVLAESPPQRTAQTTGNPQSAAERDGGNDGRYAKKNIDADQSRYAEALSDPEAMRQFAFEEGLTEDEAREIAQANYAGPSTGDIQPDQAAALKAAQPEPAPAPAPKPQPTAAEPELNLSKLFQTNEPQGPQPVVDAGFPKAGEPVAVGQNEATPLPEGTSERATAAIAASKAAKPAELNLSKIFKVEEPKPITGETAKGATLTDGLKEAGNFKKSRSGREFGKTSAWETRAGDIRRSKSDAPEPWEVKSPYDYGYFHKTVSTDGEGIDRIQPPKDAPEAGDKHFIIDQKDAETGKYDEPKVVTYVKDKFAAMDLYNRGFSDEKGPARMHDISAVTPDELSGYLAKHTTEPPKGPYSPKKITPTEVAKPAKTGRVLTVGPDQPGLTAEAKAAAAERNHGNFPVKGVPGATANTQALAEARSAIHKKIADWFEATKPPSQLDLDKETNRELLERIGKHPYPTEEGAWVPRKQPPEWQLAKQAKNLLAKPTDAQFKKFRAAERELRDPEAAENYRQGNRIKGDIENSRRSGPEAIAEAERQQVVPGKNEEEANALDRIEEAEEYKPQQIKSKDDLPKMPPKRVSVGDSALAKKVGPFEMTEAAKARKAESNALLGQQSKKPQAEKPEGWKQKTLDEFKPEDLQRMIELSNKTAKRKGLDEDAIATYDPKADMPKGDNPTSNLFNQIWNDENGALGGRTNAQRGQTTRAWLKKQLATTPVDYYAARKPHGEEPYTHEVDDKLHNVDTKNAAHLNNVQDWLAEIPNNGKRADLLAQQKRIFKAREADSAHVDLPGKQAGKTNIESLSPPDKKVWDEYLAPKVNEVNDFKDAIRAVDKDKIGPDIEHYIARIAKGDTSEYNMLKAADDPTQPVNGLKTNAGMAKERVFQSLERVSDGKRFVVQERPDGLTVWTNGKGERIRDPSYKFEANQPYSLTDAKTGQKYDFIMRHAMTDEIKANARGRDGKGKMMDYYQNAALSVAMAHAQLGAMARNMTELARISSTPKFEALTAQPGSDKAKAHPDWVKSKITNFGETVMDPQLREVFDDYAKSGFDSPELLRQLNQRVTKLLFWMPTAHILNVAAHWFVGRGFDNANLVSLYETGTRAIQSVMKQDITQKRLLDAGASLIYPTVRNRDFIEKAAKAVGEEFVRDPSTWGPLADKLHVPLKKLSQLVYDNSSKVMWAANDMFMTQRILELERKGHSTEQAIKMAERDIPNYRIPQRLIGNGEKGRILAKWMADPTTTSFGRYHVGMFMSYANIVKDAVGKDASLGDRYEAVGKMMALGVMAFVLKPMFDSLAKTVTGNSDATANARGPLSIPTHLNEARKGHEDIASAARSTMTIPPLWTSIIEAYNNKDWRGKSIVEPGDMAKGRYDKALVQEGEHFARGLVSPLGTFSTAEKKASEPGAAGVAKATGRAVRDQALDIKNPSDAARKFAFKQDQINLKNANLRERKGGYGPGEEVYNKIIDSFR